MGETKGAPAVAAVSCLSDEEIGALRAGPPGTLPEGVALHLAGCPGCQQRVLFGTEARRTSRRRDIPELPSVGRALILLLVVLAAFGVFLYTLHRLWPR